MARLERILGRRRRREAAPAAPRPWTGWDYDIKWAMRRVAHLRGVAFRRYDILSGMGRAGEAMCFDIANDPAVDWPTIEITQWPGVNSALEHVRQHGRANEGIRIEVFVDEVQVDPDATWRRPARPRHRRASSRRGTADGVPNSFTAERQGPLRDGA